MCASHDSTETRSKWLSSQNPKMQPMFYQRYQSTSLSSIFFTLRYICRRLLSFCLKHVKVLSIYINSALKQVHQTAWRLSLAQRLILICTLSVHQSDFFFSFCPPHFFALLPLAGDQIFLVAVPRLSALSRYTQVSNIPEHLKDFKHAART